LKHKERRESEESKDKDMKVVIKLNTLKKGKIKINKAKKRKLVQQKLWIYSFHIKSSYWVFLIICYLSLDLITVL
jgi:hypothetical protein